MSSIIEKQKYIQAQKNTPIYFRPKGSKFLLYPFFAVFAVTSVIPFYYAGRCALGKKANDP
ncbi:hypothetical protein ACO0SA_003553 [Hanseniaspora valbyensis]|uniref:Uncharacterized protein n=1 Tax=Hanseniaspora valbyensis NRRL Y-1626 TaxID=766949 RepID=A0A1B7TBE2_9ASCO|nr:hypothetical protein HANVADRAFT_53458 [Hanseniaspora valbyensis NRRL Y-1626]